MFTKSPIFKSCIEILNHALDHYYEKNSLRNRKLAILHMDQALELILKEKVRLLGKSIYKGKKETIGIWEAYKILTENKCNIPEWPDIELIHDERNAIQHKFASPDKSTTEFYIDNTIKFFERFLFEEFNKTNLRSLLYKTPKIKRKKIHDRIDELISSAEVITKRDKATCILLLNHALILWMRKKVIEEHGERTNYRRIHDMVIFLKKKDLIAIKKMNKIQSLIHLRNEIAYSEKIPTTTTCANMIKFLKRLVSS